MRITFTGDMPPAAVEVVAPDFSTIERLSMAAGDERAVEVPSEESFLRVHLASGETVTLKDAGNLDRTIDLAKLYSGLRRPSADSSPRPRSRRELQRRAAMPVVPWSTKGIAQLNAVIEGGLGVALAADNGFPEGCEVHEQGSAAVFRPSAIRRRYILTLDTGDARVRVRLPGSASNVTVLSNELESGQRVASVRVTTTSAHGDAIMAYLQRGDLYSASSMTDWAEKAEVLLEEKMGDPFAACVGAYLLLRLRRLELLHDWTRTLLDRFDEIPDTLVIRAWHLIYNRGEKAQVRELFARAIGAPLPVFTEGLRLLSDGARLLGEDAERAVKTLNEHAGRAFSRSPFTATVKRKGTAERRWDVDIDYAPRV